MSLHIRERLLSIDYDVYLIFPYLFGVALHLLKDVCEYRDEHVNEQNVGKQHIGDQEKRYGQNAQRAMPSEIRL